MIDPNTAQVLAYQRKDITSRGTALFEWVFQARKPRPRLSAIPSHSAILLPEPDGLTYRKYQAIAAGVEMSDPITAVSPLVQRYLIDTVPIYLPNMARARAWARHQVGDDYAWSEIAAAAWDEIVPSFLAVTGQHPREEICSMFVLAIILAGGRVFDKPSGVTTPYVMTCCAKALSADYAACQRQR